MNESLRERISRHLATKAPPIQIDELLLAAQTAGQSPNPWLVWPALAMAAAAALLFVATTGKQPDNPAVEPTTPTAQTPPSTSSTPAAALTYRPILPGRGDSPDWERLSNPEIELEGRTSGVMLATGRELIVWGGLDSGAALRDGAWFSFAEEAWHTMSIAPFLEGEVERFPGWVWTGEHLLVWSGGRLAAWDPDTNHWEDHGVTELRAGSFHQRAIWTGLEVIDSLAGVAYNPRTRETRKIALPPASPVDDRRYAVWTGEEILLLPDGPTYLPSADSWVEVPTSGLSRQSVGGVWTNGEVVAVDYLLEVAVYDPGARLWREARSVAAVSGECPVHLVSIETWVFLDYCDQFAIREPANGGWALLSPPQLATEESSGAHRLVPGRQYLYAVGGSGVWRLVHSNYETIQASLRRVGNGYFGFDVPPGWRSVPPPDTEQFRFVGNGGECGVEIADEWDHEAEVADLLNQGGMLVEVPAMIGGPNYRAVVREDPERPSLLWEPPAHPVTITCSSISDARHLLSHAIWLYQGPDGD